MHDSPLEFAEDGVKKKHPANSGSSGRNALLMRELRAKLV